MKKTIEQLQEELVRTAKLIIEAYDKQPLTEEWPSILNSLRPYDKEQLRKAMINRGYDIENISSNIEQITSNRDFRLKEGVVILDLSDARGGVAVFIDGKNVVRTSFHTSRGIEYTDTASWKTMLAAQPTIYRLAFDSQVASELAAKRNDRKEAKKGSVDRYTNDNKPRGTTLDKSGYIRDPYKYEKMLADAGVDNGVEILSQAKALYLDLAQHLEFSGKDEGYELLNVLNNLGSAFRSLTQALEKYNLHSVTTASDADQWAKDYYKQTCADSIRQIRRLMTVGKKLLSTISD